MPRGSKGEKRSADVIGAAVMAGYTSVSTMQTTRRVHALIERSEHHREHSAESTVKSPDRVGKGAGMPFNGSSHPRMSKLQQQRTTGSEENRTLPINLPGERPRTEHTLSGSSGCRAHALQLTFQAFRADYQ
jgi:hypothetical protein